jgi:probable HAF family extracellular repeat protein
MRHQQVLDFAPESVVAKTMEDSELAVEHDALAVEGKVKERITTRNAKGGLFVVALAVCCVLALAGTTAAQQYQVSYLDSLGGTSSRGNSINDRGWIAGFSRLAGDANRHATLWRGGSLLDLGTLGGADKNSSVAWPVKNNRGIIAGISQTDTPEPNGENWSCFAFFSGPRRGGFTCLGFIWEKGTMKPLHPLPGGNNSFATGADNRGRVVGWAENGVHDSTCVGTQVLQFRPVVWGPDTHQIQKLPLIAGDTSGAATAINDRGQIVGITGICDQAVGRYTARHAVMWDDGKVIDIGNFGVGLWNTPMSINQRGDIVGFAGTDPNDLDGNFLRGFKWTRKDGIDPLDPLPVPGHVFSQANAINERGQVVGISCTIDGDCLAELWENDVKKNLNDLVAPGFNGVLVTAQDINDAGEITGRAFDPATGQLRAFIAIPVSGHEVEIGTMSTFKVSALPEHVRRTLREQRGLITSIRPR